MNKNNIGDEINNNSVYVLYNEKSKIERKKCSNWDKYVYTICMFFNHFAYGMTSNLFGPAMVDMKYIFNTSMNYITLFNTFSSFGYLTGSLAGFLYKYLNRQMTVVFMVMILAIGGGLTPFCPNLWLLYLASFLTQLGGGVWDNSNSVWIIEIWQKKSPAALHISQFMYGLGCILGPLLDKPFLTGELKSNTTTNSSMFNKSVTEIDINETIDRRSKLEIPFTIGGAIQLIGAILFLTMLFIKKYKPPIDEGLDDDQCENKVISKKSDENFNSCTNIIESSKINRNILIGLIAFTLSMYGCIEAVHFGYSSTYYQFIDLQISAPKAAQILSVMSSTFTFGRLFSAFIANKIKPEIMLLYHYFIIIASIIILYFGRNSEIVIWIGNAMIGFGFSAMWPTFYAFADKHIKLTNKVSTVFSLTAGILSLIIPFIIGPYIENHPIIFVLMEISYFIISLSLFIVILFIVKKS